MTSHRRAARKAGGLRRSHRLRTVFLAVVAGIIASVSIAEARSLSSIFITELKGLEMEPLGPALANTVASTYPVASASSSVTYVYDRATETFERQTRVLGPIIGERAETIGKGQLNIGFSYSYVHPTSINGQDLSSLENVPVINGRVVSFPVPDGVILADGRFTTFLPIQVMADLDVKAQLMTPSVTYGITPDWDVNLTLPLVYTSLKVTGTATIPDPRLAQFALSPGDPNAKQGPIPSANESAFGAGDLLLRTKYTFLRDQPVDLAALLGVSFPTGNPDNFAGTGTYQVQPTLILSRVFAERFEPLLNLGVNIDANDVNRSSFRWAVGSSAQIYGPLSGILVFLGDNEFSAQSDPIEAPFFFQIERNDLYDASVGFRYLFLETGVISANFIVPLNDQGLRADFIPTVEVEYAF
jgi:hypothetical protein